MSTRANARVASLTAIVAALALSAPALAGAQRGQTKPAFHTITIDATTFSPAELTIRAGDTVTWINKDIIPHTATGTAARRFDSGTLAAGASWKRTFTSKGDIDYICRFHPTMKGRLRVK